MAFKPVLRRRGVRVVSIIEQVDDTLTGKLLARIHRKDAGWPVGSGMRGEGPGCGALIPTDLPEWGV